MFYAEHEKRRVFQMWGEKAMTKGPKLRWVPSVQFPGEYEANVGDIQFSVATAVQVDICARGAGGHRMIIIDCGDSKNLTAAKRKCQQWIDKQWKAMQKMKEEHGG